MNDIIISHKRKFINIFIEKYDGLYFPTKKDLESFQSLCFVLGFYAYYSIVKKIAKFSQDDPVTLFLSPYSELPNEYITYNIIPELNDVDKNIFTYYDEMFEGFNINFNWSDRKREKYYIRDNKVKHRYTVQEDDVLYFTEITAFKILNKINNR